MFFFKQKTAYEMRISDWSSDVCSSDLDEEGQKDQEADLKGGLQLAGDKGGQQDREGNILRARIIGRLGDLGEHHQVGLGRVPHHEAMDGGARPDDGLADVDLSLAIRGDSDGVDLAADRMHSAQPEKKRRWESHLEGK